MGIPPRERPAETELLDRLDSAASGSLAATSDDLSLDLAAGYRIQRRSRARQLAAGAHRAGWKIGLTSPAAQRAKGLRHPVLGHLFADTVVGPGAPAPLTITGSTALRDPRVEFEIAFLLAAPLSGADPSVADVLAATGALRLALEIVDSRWESGAPTAGTLVADNVSNAATVLGDALPAGVDLAALTASLTVGGRRSSGGSEQVLGHPARAVAWLARELAHTGESLAAGDIVLSGTLCPPVAVDADDRIAADLARYGRLRTRWPAG